MSWNWVQGGDSLYAALFSLSNCQVRIWPILIIFLKKGHATYITEAEEKTWSQKFILTPWNRVFLKASVTFPELRGTFQNWGPASVMMPLAIAAAEATCCRGFSKIEVRPSLLENYLASGYDQTMMPQTRKWKGTTFPKLRAGPHFWKKWPPLKVTGYFGA